MKDQGGIDAVIEEDLGNVSTLEEAKSVNSDDALLMSMGKKPELRRGECNTIPLPMPLHSILTRSSHPSPSSCLAGIDTDPPSLQSTTSGPSARTRS
jgi:hypothetical protein